MQFPVKHSCAIWSVLFSSRVKPIRNDFTIDRASSNLPSATSCLTCAVLVSGE
nr:MAG TPA: hypothetical protein [Caudoviricetes sp.]